MTDFLLGNTKEDIFNNASTAFFPYNESQWGPKQHLIPLTFIVWTKNFYMFGITQSFSFWVNCPFNKTKSRINYGQLLLEFLIIQLILTWYSIMTMSHSMHTSAMMAKSGLIVVSALWAELLILMIFVLGKHMHFMKGTHGSWLTSYTNLLLETEFPS